MDKHFTQKSKPNYYLLLLALLPPCQPVVTDRPSLLKTNLFLSKVKGKSNYFDLH